MSLTTTEYFEAIKAALDEYYDLRQNGEDVPRPVSPGAAKAARAFCESKGKNGIRFGFGHGTLWDHEIADFCKAMCEAGVTELICGETSTGLMDIIHGFEKNGWILSGTWKEQKKDKWFEEGDPVEYELGIIFRHE